MTDNIIGLHLRQMDCLPEVLLHLIFSYDPSPQEDESDQFKLSMDKKWALLKEWLVNLLKITRLYDSTLKVGRFDDSQIEALWVVYKYHVSEIGLSPTKIALSRIWSPSFFSKCLQNGVDYPLFYNMMLYSCIWPKIFDGLGKNLYFVNPF